jgi:hypothetical protein
LFATFRRSLQFFFPMPVSLLVEYAQEQKLVVANLLQFDPYSDLEREIEIQDRVNGLAWRGAQIIVQQNQGTFRTGQSIRRLLDVWTCDRTGTKIGAA